MMRQALYFLLLLLIPSSSFSQKKYFKSYALPANGAAPVINHLYQDSRGYIMVAASTGLFRFDGLNFSKLAADKQVPEDVTAVCETSDGRTWVGFANGKLAWLRQNKLVLQNPEEGLPAKSIRKIVQDATGVVWIATAGEGVYYYRNNRFYNINTDDGLSDNYVYDLSLDRSTVYAATDRGINQLQLQGDRKIVRTFTSREGLPDNIIRALSPRISANQEPSHCFWIAMQDAGAGYYCPAASTTGAVAAWNYGQANSVLQSGRNLFVGSEDYGLIRYEIAANGSLQKPEVLAEQKVTALLLDKEGNLWAAGNDQLIRTNGSKLLPLLQLPEKESQGLHALLVDKEDHIWMNVAAGLKHLEKDSLGRWKEKIYRLPVSVNAGITALYEDKFDNIWIGTMGNGAFLLDSRTGKYRKITEDALLNSASVLSITGRDQHVWIASLEGAVHAVLQEGNANIEAPIRMQDLTAISGLGTNYIYHVFPDSRGRTWFATDGKGIALYQQGKFTSFGEQQGLKSQVVYQVAEDKQGNIWFTTFNAGVVKFDGRRFRHFTTTDGLTDMNITSMIAGADGNLYLSHRKGIDIIHTATGSVSYLDEEQGISIVNTDLNTITTNSKGEVYFMADNAIYRHRGSAAAAPLMVIDRIQLFLSDVAVEDGHHFASNENNLSFHYTGLFYSQPGKLQYQYKLEGFGEEWITTNDRRKDFPRLGPGNYTFRVRASLNKNFENAPEASFRFSIATPVWQRWWFLLLAAATVGLILYFYIKAREKRLQKLERLEKEKIRSQLETLRNQVNPHFLFNSFNTLVSEIEEDPKRAVEYVEHMADFFRSIVTYREKDIISLGEEIHIIRDYLFIQQKRYGDAFQVQIPVTPEEEEQYFLAPLTLQLLAENAIKHNTVLRHHPLVLEIFVEADQLVVRNNIHPRLHPEKSAGLGLQNIHRRYELLTRKTVMVSNDDEYFTVIIPLIKKADVSSTDSRR